MGRLSIRVLLLAVGLVPGAQAVAATEIQAPCDLVHALVRLDAPSGSTGQTADYGRELADAVQRYGHVLDLTEDQMSRWSRHLREGATGTRPWSRVSLLNMAAVCDAARQPFSRAGTLSDLKLGAGAVGPRHQRFPQIDWEPAKFPGGGAASPQLRAVLAFLVAFTALPSVVLYHFRRVRVRERREERHFCNVPVQLFSRSLQRMPSTMVDCSMNGCMLTQVQPRMDKGTLLHIHTPVGLVPARVMWANTCYFGVRFSKSLQEIELSLLIMRPQHGPKEARPHRFPDLHVAHAGPSVNRLM